MFSAKYGSRSLVALVVLGASILLSYQNCGPITKKQAAGTSTPASIAPTPTTSPANAGPVPDAFANSKLKKCLRPQVISIPFAASTAPKNAYILSRGVIGNPDCPDPRIPYLESYKVVSGTAGVSVETISLGGDAVTDPVGIFDANGTEFYIFVVRDRMTLDYRTVPDATWTSLGGVIEVLPNSLCDPNKRVCREAGFDVVSSFNGRNEFHFLTVSGSRVFIRSMTEYWVDFGGGARSSPLFVRNANSIDVLQVQGGGDLCYQSDINVDSPHLQQMHQWAPPCDAAQ